MAEMAENGWKWLDVAEDGWNGWNDCKWLALTGID